MLQKYKNMTTNGNDFGELTQFTPEM